MFVIVFAPEYNAIAGNLSAIVCLFQVSGGAACSDLGSIPAFPHTCWARQDHGVETDCKHNRNRFTLYVISKKHDAGNRQVAHWLHAVTFTPITSVHTQMCIALFDNWWWWELLPLRKGSSGHVCSSSLARTARRRFRARPAKHSVCCPMSRRQLQSCANSKESGQQQHQVHTPIKSCMHAITVIIHV